MRGRVTRRRRRPGPAQPGVAGQSVGAAVSRGSSTRAEACLFPHDSPHDSQAYARAFAKLDLLVVVDVAFTETARLAHYVLPAASQFEKWECTGFNLEFPVNAFQLRKPLFAPLGETLPEPEIYTRLLEAMGEIGRASCRERVSSPV